MKQNMVFFLALSGVVAAKLIEWTGLPEKVFPDDRFMLRILETTVGESEYDGFAAIIVTTEITNLSPRPMTAADFKLVIRQGERKIRTEAVRVDKLTTFHIRSKVGKSLILNGSEWLPAKTANSTLEKGESRTGFLFFWTRDASGNQIIDREDTQFAISFIDSLGRKFEAVYDAGRLNFQPRRRNAARPGGVFSSSGVAANRAR